MAAAAFSDLECTDYYREISAILDGVDAVLEICYEHGDLLRELLQQYMKDATVPLSTSVAAVASSEPNAELELLRQQLRDTKAKYAALGGIKSTRHGLPAFPLPPDQADEFNRLSKTICSLKEQKEQIATAAAQIDFCNEEQQRMNKQINKPEWLQSIQEIAQECDAKLQGYLTLPKTAQDLLVARGVRDAEKFKPLDVVNYLLFGVRDLEQLGHKEDLELANFVYSFPILADTNNVCRNSKEFLSYLEEPLLLMQNILEQKDADLTQMNDTLQSLLPTCQFFSQLNSTNEQSNDDEASEGDTADERSSADEQSCDKTQASDSTMQRIKKLLVVCQEESAGTSEYRQVLTCLDLIKKDWAEQITKYLLSFEQKLASYIKELNENLKMSQTKRSISEDGALCLRTNLQLANGMAKNLQKVWQEYDPNHRPQSLTKLILSTQNIMRELRVLQNSSTKQPLEAKQEVGAPKKATQYSKVTPRKSEFSGNPAAFKFDANGAGAAAAKPIAQEKENVKTQAASAARFA